MSEKQPPDLSMEHLPQNTENRKEPLFLYINGFP